MYYTQTPVKAVLWLRIVREASLSLPIQGGLQLGEYPHPLHLQGRLCRIFSFGGLAFGVRGSRTESMIPALTLCPGPRLSPLSTHSLSNSSSGKQAIGKYPRAKLASVQPFFFFLAALGLRCCARAFSGCGEWGLLFVAVHGLLIAVASLIAEHRR